MKDLERRERKRKQIQKSFCKNKSPVTGTSWNNININHRCYDLHTTSYLVSL